MNYIEDYGNGILCIDSGLYRHRHTAAYLVQDGGELAFVDTGTSNSLPRMLAAIESLGLDTGAVRWIIPTHVHLDHAGGAGVLMQACPNASLVVHPKGAPHMIDPSKLQAGAIAVYGEEAFMRDYGDIPAVDASRVIAAEDGQRFPLGDRELVFLHTPGHANHHGCILDTATRSLFTGDTFGLSYRELDTAAGPFLLATTTPVAFDPEAWETSLEHMQAQNPQAVCLTHFSRLSDPAPLWEVLREDIRAHRDMALSEEDGPADGRQQRLKDKVGAHLVSRVQAHCPDMPEAEIREILVVDIELNAQGLEVWLKRRAKARADGRL